MRLFGFISIVQDQPQIILNRDFYMPQDRIGEAHRTSADDSYIRALAEWIKS